MYSPPENTTRTSGEATGSFNGAYGKMKLVPESMYRWMLQTAKQVIPAVNQHVINRNVQKAREHANDPKLYRYYMTEASLYKKHNVNNPDVDNRIRQSFTDRELQRINGQISQLKNNSRLLKTTEGMKTYQNLQVEKERRYSVLENAEHEKYRQFVNNPTNTLQQIPESMKDVTYHTNAIKSVLASHPNMISTDVSGDLYVDGKKVSTNPKQVGRLIHFVSHDYSDLTKAPEGTREFVKALKNRGFQMEDIGNTYLREKLLHPPQKPLTMPPSTTPRRRQLPTPPSSSTPPLRRRLLPETPPSSSGSTVAATTVTPSGNVKRRRRRRRDDENEENKSPPPAVEEQGKRSRKKESEQRRRSEYNLRDAEERKEARRKKRLKSKI